MKYLNLDKFTPATGRFLKVGGIDHAINSIGVGEFIDTNLALQKIDMEDMLTQLNFTIDLIIKLVPTLKREQLTPYTLDQVNEIADFVRGADVEHAEVVEDEEAGK